MISRFWATLHTRPQILLVPLALLALMVALWAGLLRMGWHLPIASASLAALHGPLILVGFFGTVIGLERAIALQRHWMYLAPLGTALGGLTILFWGSTGPEPFLIMFGSVIACAAFVIILRQHLALWTVTMSLGAFAWCVGNVFWLAGQPLFVVSLWWAGFLVLTIAGERLELGRLLQHSRFVQWAFAVIVTFMLVSLFFIVADYTNGTRLVGVAWLALALWLLRYDIARRTVRKRGLTRFIAVCLLSGYVWLAVSGAIGFIYGGLPAGPIYDAFLHALFVGFVFAMIFGHAPIIIPAFLGIKVAYQSTFYIPLVLLHCSLLLRVIGDLANWMVLRQWGGMFNVLAILGFIGLIIVATKQAHTITTSPTRVHHLQDTG